MHTRLVNRANYRTAKNFYCIAVSHCDSLLNYQLRYEEVYYYSTAILKLYISLIAPVFIIVKFTLVEQIKTLCKRWNLVESAPDSLLIVTTIIKY